LKLLDPLLLPKNLDSMAIGLCANGWQKILIGKSTFIIEKKIFIEVFFVVVIAVSDK
jgi:hypothetical protein